MTYMTTKYMEKVLGGPYPGYRIRPRYQRLISKNPANSGNLFKDANGRPSGAILASLYLGPGHKDYYEGEFLTFLLYLTKYFQNHHHKFRS